MPTRKNAHKENCQQGKIPTRKSAHMYNSFQIAASSAWYKTKFCLIILLFLGDSKFI